MIKTFLCYICFIPFIGYTQKISRSNLNCFGQSVSQNNILLSQSFGQSSIIGLSKNESISLRQVFQQPFDLSLTKTEAFFMRRLSYSVLINNQLSQLVKVENDITGSKKNQLW